VDWTSYNAWFPKRYLQRGQFDEAVDSALGAKSIKVVLEIGGGALGCHSLRPAKARKRRKVYAIEPFVRAPAWVQANLSWAEAIHALRGTCDLVIARGVLNYLLPSELKRIPELLAPKGLFLANTFRQAPENTIKRMDVTGNGDHAEEKIFQIAPGILEHNLTVRHSLVVVYQATHRIYHYSLDDLAKWLGPGCSFQNYGSNSVLINVTGEDL
jgi:hypothetical protein